ncbi:MAG: hypothetical protein IJ751_01430 [Oscillospiraceae bacterium]|nr:hypothetical protein [Oscillospiraceae bacterium]
MKFSIAYLSDQGAEFAKIVLAIAQGFFHGREIRVAKGEGWLRVEVR